MTEKIKDYMADIALNIEKEGDAQKEYLNLLSRLSSGINYCKSRLEEDVEYESEEKDEMHEEKLTEEEKAEYLEFIAQAQSVYDAIVEITSDEANHNIILQGLIAKYACISPQKDGLSNAIENLMNNEKEEKDDN